MGGGSAITPDLVKEISSLRAEHGGSIGVLLVLYATQIYPGNEVTSDYAVDIWIDNKEVRLRGTNAQMGRDLQAHLVLDYDL